MIFHCKIRVNSTRTCNDKLLMIGAISFIKHFFCEINDALIRDPATLY